MTDIYDTMVGIDPTTNPRFKQLSNGQWTEQMADQVQLFWDPVTQDGRALFNSAPYLNLGTTYVPLQAVPDIMQVDFIDKLGTCYGAGLVDPVTNEPLDKISVAGVSLIVKAVFDTEFKARAAALAAAAAGTTSGASGSGSGASGIGGSGTSTSGTSSSGSGTSGI